MTTHSRVAIMLWIWTLASMPFSASAIDSCSYTYLFSVATNPTLYQCCAGLHTEVTNLMLGLSGLSALPGVSEIPTIPQAFNSFSGTNPEALRESSQSKVMINENSHYIVVKNALSATCVNVAKSSQTERILRQSESWGCREVLGYERVGCFCTVDCLGQRKSDCPGVLPGDCPVVPSTGLDSISYQRQPWLLSISSSPCSFKSICGGAPRPGPNGH